METWITYIFQLLGVLALAGVVWGFFWYITASGNQDRVEAGKHAMLYSAFFLIGLAVLYLVFSFLFGLVGG